jgi:hypothetical protein
VSDRPNDAPREGSNSLPDLGLGPLDDAPSAMRSVPLNRTVTGERCDDCGNRYDDVYWIDDDLWALIHERAPAGLLCPSCAVRRGVTAIRPDYDRADAAFRIALATKGIDVEGLPARDSTVAYENPCQ